MDFFLLIYHCPLHILKYQELRTSLEGQISELSEKEAAVKKLRKVEERERMILEELQFLSKEREKEHAKIVAERNANIVNMVLSKFKLKKKVVSILSEIILDLKMLEKIKEAVVKVSFKVINLKPISIHSVM